MATNSQIHIKKGTFNLKHILFVLQFFHFDHTLNSEVVERVSTVLPPYEAIVHFTFVLSQKYLIFG